MTTRRIPIIPTILVLAAAAVMVALGVWQLGRAEEKTALIAAYEQALATGGPPVPLSTVQDPQANLYREVTLDCRQPASWRGIAGRNRNGQSGYAHYFTCSAESLQGRFDHTVEVGIGWSRSPERPEWTGGPIEGLVTQGGEQGFMVIANEAKAGLEPLARPDPADLPNNHLAYAGQWFFFALTALAIYWLALKRRWSDQG